MHAKPVSDLVPVLGYAFGNLTLLEVACTHKSYGNENRPNEPIAIRNNERFEFLGDAILDLVVSLVLLEQYPKSPEGELSKLRASLVNEKSLSKIARNLKLGEFILLGRGEDLTGGREKESILASTLEAIIAAVFTDGGFAAADAWVRGLFAGNLKVFGASEDVQDYKTRLQEIVQARYRVAPRYEVVESTGPDHDKTFRVELMVNGKVIAAAAGKSKKEAEQAAAKAAFEQYGPRIEI